MEFSEVVVREELAESVDVFFVILAALEQFQDVVFDGFVEVYVVDLEVVPHFGRVFPYFVVLQPQLALVDEGLGERVELKHFGGSFEEFYQSIDVGVVDDDVEKENFFFEFVEVGFDDVLVVFAQFFDNLKELLPFAVVLNFGEILRSFDSLEYSLAVVQVEPQFDVELIVKEIGFSLAQMINLLLGEFGEDAVVDDVVRRFDFLVVFEGGEER